MKDIRDILRGMDADQVGATFGPYVRQAYEACRNGASPYEQFPKNGVRYMAGLEARAQYRREWNLNRRVALARQNATID